MSTSSTTSLDSEKREMQPLALNSTGNGAPQGGHLARLFLRVLTHLESFLTFSELLKARHACRAMNDASYNTPAFKIFLRIKNLGQWSTHREVMIDNVYRLSPKPAYDAAKGFIALHRTSPDQRTHWIEVQDINTGSAQKVSATPDCSPVEISGEKDLLITTNPQVGAIDLYSINSGQRINSISDKGLLGRGLTNSSMQYFTRAVQGGHRVEFFDLGSLNVKTPQPQFSSVIERNDVVSYDPDKKIAIYYTKKTFGVWDFTTQKTRWVFKNHIAEGRHYDAQSGVFYATREKPAQILLYNVVTGEVVREYNVEQPSGKETLHALHVDAASRKIFANGYVLARNTSGSVVSYDKNRVMCWDIDTGKMLTSFYTPSPTRKADFTNLQFAYEPTTQFILCGGTGGLRFYTFEGILVRTFQFSFPSNRDTDRMNQYYNNHFIWDQKAQRLIGGVSYFPERSAYPTCFVGVLDYSKTPDFDSVPKSQEPPAKRAHTEEHKETKDSKDQKASS